MRAGGGPQRSSLGVYRDDGTYSHEVILEIKSDCAQMEVSVLLCVQTSLSSPVSTAAQAQVRAAASGPK